MLPATNCKTYGEKSCFNSGLKLASGQTHVAECLPLYSVPNLAEGRERIESLLSGGRSALPSQDEQRR